VEVPVMLSLVAFANATQRHFPGDDDAPVSE
jgi:ACR3 family arsenite efflux pump ArsB